LDNARQAVRRVEQSAANDANFTVQVAQSLRSPEEGEGDGPGLRAGVTPESFYDDRTRVPCIEGYVASYIDADGSVFSCCLRSSSIVNQHMGDVTRTPFAEIWRGEAYRAFRRESFLLDPRRAAIDENSCAHCPKAKHFLYLIDEFTSGNYLDLARRKAEAMENDLTALREQMGAHLTLPPEAMQPAFVRHEVLAECRAGVVIEVFVTVRNDGNHVWPGIDLAGRQAVGLGYHLLDRRGRMLRFDNNPRAYLPRDLAPGEVATLRLSIRAPEEPGSYQIELAMVQENVAWFEQAGGATLRLPWKVIS